METIVYSVENQVGYLKLNIPDKMNALRAEMKKELLALFSEIRTDPNIRALVITGEGKAFCAGGDISTLGDKQKNNEGRDRMLYSVDFIKMLEAFEKPVIAAVNGYAVGAGLSISLACDFIICSEKASFGSAFINLSSVPDLGCVWNLVRRVGVPKAKEITYTGRSIKAAEALEIGLADKVVAPEDLMATAKEMAEKFAQGPTYGIGLTKSLINRAYDNSFLNYLEMEANAQAAAFHTVDHTMAVNAFINKTEKNFIGK